MKDFEPEEVPGDGASLGSGVGEDGVEPPQSPCVADRCSAVFDRRFLVEERFDSAKGDVEALVKKVSAASPRGRFELEDLTVAHPAETPEDSPLIAAIQKTIATVAGREAELIASPGTYEQKHVARIGRLEHAVAYGPGILELAHQVDEYCAIEDLVKATQVLALTLVELSGSARR